MPSLALTRGEVSTTSASQPGADHFETHEVLQVKCHRPFVVVQIPDVRGLVGRPAARRPRLPAVHHFDEIGAQSAVRTLFGTNPGEIEHSEAREGL